MVFQLMGGLSQSGAVKMTDRYLVNKPLPAAGLSADNVRG